jgi:RHS repeat-associated protein
VGNVTSVTDADNNVTKFAFDGDNRLTQQTDPLNKTTTFAYDAGGRMTSTTDRLGRVRNLSYDADNRQTGETWVTSGVTVNTVTFTYDANGNQLTAANNNGAYTLSYDALNRVTTVAEPFGQSLTFAYDNVGNRTLVQDSKGGVATSVYDSANELTSRQFGGTGQTPLREDFTYNGTNQIATATRYSDLAGTTKVGVATYSYDADNRLSNLQQGNGSGTAFANYTYGYDTASNVKTETLNSTTTTYSYDATNQLTSDGRNSFTYDATGNRKNTGYTTGTGNQLTNDGTWTYSYDAEGNLTKKTKGTNAETWTFGYDAVNHLVWVEQRQTDGGTLLLRDDIKYDPYGNRIEKDVNTESTVVTRYALDGWKVKEDSQGRKAAAQGNANWDVWADLDGTTNLQTRYVRADEVDQILARVNSLGTAVWYQTDIRGSVRNLTDNSGAVADTISYDGFGNVTTESTPSFGDRWKFTGRELDSETGLLENRWRYYNPSVGRWTNQDPIGINEGDMNLYRYVQNNPTGNTDPSGEKKFGRVKAIASTYQFFEDFLEKLEKEKVITQNNAVDTRLNFEKVYDPFDFENKNDLKKGFVFNVFKKGKVITASFRDILRFKAPVGGKKIKIFQTGKITKTVTNVDCKSNSNVIARWVEGWTTFNDGTTKGPDQHGVDNDQLAVEKVLSVKYVLDLEVGVGEYKGKKKPNQQLKGYYEKWNNGLPSDVNWTGETTKYQVIMKYNNKGEWEFHDKSIKLDKEGVFNKLK